MEQNNAIFSNETYEIVNNISVVVKRMRAIIQSDKASEESKEMARRARTLLNQALTASLEANSNYEEEI